MLLFDCKIALAKIDIIVTGSLGHIGGPLAE